MAGDQAKFLRLALHGDCDLCRDPGMADAVEAVAPDAKVRADVFRQRVLARAPREGGVKGGVEHGDLRHASEQLARTPYRFDCRRVVQRRQMVERAERRQRRIVDQRGPREAFTAMHHAMHHGVEFAELAPARAQLREQGVECRMDVRYPGAADVPDAQVEACARAGPPRSPRT